MAVPALRYLSLFSGAGGLDEGLRLAVPHARCVCYVERELPAAAILAARIADGFLDDAPVWSDVSTFDGRPWRGAVDLVVGGFPCTDISSAGKREGLVEGNASGLWYEMARIVREVRPRLLFVENVGALTVRGLDAVLGSLAEMGFSAEWGVLAAAAVGAPHKRERFFLLANADGRGARESGWKAERRDVPGRPSKALADAGCVQPGAGPVQGGPRGAEAPEHQANDWAPHRGGALDDAHDRRCGRQDDRLRPGRDCPGRAGAGVEHTDAAESSAASLQDGWRPIGAPSGDLAEAPRERCGEAWSGSDRRSPQWAGGSLPVFPPGPGDHGAWAAILSAFPDIAPALEPDIRGLADGLAAGVDAAARTHRLRAGGNGVVSLQAAVMFRVLAGRLGLDMSAELSA